MVPHYPKQLNNGIPWKNKRNASLAIQRHKNLKRPRESGMDGMVKLFVLLV